jgi:hypothetical protein
MMVAEKGRKNQAALEKWIYIGKKFAMSLPENKAKAKKTKTSRGYKG